ncbi:MAG: LPXTG cell wall anchor domain-containing protein [Candidatus Nitrosocaldus sp.]
MIRLERKWYKNSTRSIVSILCTSSIMLILLLSSTILPVAYSAVPEPRNPEDCPSIKIVGSPSPCEIEQQQEISKEVKFVNLYFGDPNTIINGFPAKVEMAPGDGVGTLIAVMANSGAFELTGLRAWIYLPVGFEAYGRGENEPAFDTYDFTVARGGTFYFEFPVRVKDGVVLGIHQAWIRVEYYRSNDVGLHFRNFNVEFMLTGRSVMDASVESNVIIPGRDNPVRINISNKGSAPASGVTASLTSTSALLSTGEGSVWSLGSIEPGASKHIDLMLYANPNIANTLQSLQINLEYRDSYGQHKSAVMSINLLVRGSIGSADLRLASERYIIETIKKNDLTITVSNLGDESARAVEVTINTTSLGSTPLSIVDGDGYYKLGDIMPGTSKRINLSIFTSSDANNKTFDIPARITYLDSTGGLHSIERSISVYALGSASIRMYDLSITYIGNEPNLTGYLLNEGSDTAFFTSVEMVEDTLRPAAGAQYLGDLLVNSPLPFNIPISSSSSSSADTPGLYNVKVKVNYKDALRNAHELILEGKVYYSPVRVSAMDRDGAGSSPSLLPTGVQSPVGVLLIGVAGAALAGYIAWRRRKSSRLQEIKI